MLTRIPTLLAFLALVGCSSGGDGDPAEPPTSPPPPVSPPPPPAPIPGALDLDPVAVSVDEAAGGVTLTVRRSGGTDGSVSVDIVFTPLTADGADASVTTARVTFADGDDAPKDVSIVILDDPDVEGDESFSIELRNPTGGASVGSAATATVTIVDDDRGPPAGPVFGLNDTGVSLCATEVETGLPCGETGTTDAFAGQDAERGLDPASMSDDDGKLGFSFTKLDDAGAPLADQKPDYATLPWACVRDEVTGLTWEVKTNDGGLNDRSWTYTWYSDATLPPKGALYGGECATSRRCDTQRFAEDVNTAALCGFTDWRLPTASELMSIVDYQPAGGRAVDERFFPNTTRDLYWTSDLPLHPGDAFYVGFIFGESRTISHRQRLALRLVRGGQ